MVRGLGIYQHEFGVLILLCPSQAMQGNFEKVSHCKIIHTLYLIVVSDCHLFYSSAEQSFYCLGTGHGIGISYYYDQYAIVPFEDLQERAETFFVREPFCDTRTLIRRLWRTSFFRIVFIVIIN